MKNDAEHMSAWQLGDANKCHIKVIITEMISSIGIYNLQRHRAKARIAYGIHEVIPRALNYRYSNAELW